MARHDADSPSRGPMQCQERWPYDEPRDQCMLNAWHAGPHKTVHEEGHHMGKDKHIWPNAAERVTQQ
jgi:hypothetical protein